MSESHPITVNILDKDYLVGCADDEKDALLEAANFLDERMRQIRDSGTVMGSERIAVITALNLTNEMLSYKTQCNSLESDIGAGLQRIFKKIERALRDDKLEETA